MIVAVAQAAAGVAAVLTVMQFGISAGPLPAVGIIMVTPWSIAFVCRLVLKKRSVIRPVIVAAPVWVAVAVMSSLFTSLDFFLSGHAANGVALLILFVAAIIGAVIGTTDVETA